MILCRVGQWFDRNMIGEFIMKKVLLTSLIMAVCAGAVFAEEMNTGGCKRNPQIEANRQQIQQQRQQIQGQRQQLREQKEQMILQRQQNVMQHQQQVQQRMQERTQKMNDKMQKMTERSCPKK